MKEKYLITFLILLSYQGNTQQPNDKVQVDTDPIVTPGNVKSDAKKKINFFIVSKRKKGKLDLATRYNIFRARMKSVFHRKKIRVIVADNLEVMTAKVSYRLKKSNARLGTIWFDSHGVYKRGYSLFLIGHDEISFRAFADTTISGYFRKLSGFATSSTNIVIGSCYGGATFTRSSIDYKDTTRMNGDSLMLALGKIFKKSKIYASESWVMTKPGLFNKHRIAVAGFPKRKLFRDLCYRPAWENIGKWNLYNAASESFYPVNPVGLDKRGNLQVANRGYFKKKEQALEVRRFLSRLEPNLYK